jgi:hypothetical protein
LSCTQNKAKEKPKYKHCNGGSAKPIAILCIHTHAIDAGATHYVNLTFTLRISDDNSQRLLQFAALRE